MLLAWQKDGEIFEDDTKETKPVFLLMHINSIEVLEHFVI